MSKANPDFSLHTGAAGGGQLGRHRAFLKEPDPQIRQGLVAAKRQEAVASGQKLDNRRFESDPDEFRTDKGRGAAQEYSAGGKEKSAVRSGDKSLKPVKPKG